MTPDNQVLLDAIRELGTRMERLEGRMGGLEGRMGGLEGRMERIEDRVETIDARTSQLSSDFLDLRERVPLLEERVDNGFRSIKSDLNFAFKDSRTANVAQERSDKVIDGLRREIANIQLRLAALEGAKGA